MATRSTIALEFADGTVGQVYCHWDGYLSYNGALLNDHYKDPFKVRELIDMGDLSSLGSEIGRKHDFDSRIVDECTFYGRDRKDADSEATYFADFSEYFTESQSEDYDYILRKDGQWYVRHDGSNREFINLDAALDELK